MKIINPLNGCELVHTTQENMTFNGQARDQKILTLSFSRFEYPHYILPKFNYFEDLNPMT